MVSAANIESMCAADHKARQSGGMPASKATIAQCECAVRKVQEGSGEAEFLLYSEVGQAYFENLGNGMPRQDAWMAAAGSVGETLGLSAIDIIRTTQHQSDLHQKALAECE